MSLTVAGRPSRYNHELAMAICSRMAEGELLALIVKPASMPNRATIYRWTEQNPEFRSLFTRAREQQAHAVAEKGVLMALDATPENAQAKRVQFDGYKWFASKLLPKVYGDKMLHTGADGEGPVAVKLALDYSLLTVQELVQFRALIDKATPKRLEASNAPQIEGQVSDGEDSDA